MTYSTETKEFLSIATPEDVAAFLGMTYSGLGKQLYGWKDEFRYRQFDIPKKSGGVRRISSPRKWLKEYQRKVADALLEIYSGHKAVHGFVNDRSIVTNAVLHSNKRFIFNIDIENFFDSVNYGRVRGLFASKFFGLPMTAATVVAQLCCFKGQLPQGAPSSPIITNFISLHMDRRLYRLAASNRCTYTRYADDITFSFTAPKKGLPSEIVQEAAGEILPGHALDTIVRSSGFVINKKKTRLQGRTQRQEVTGLVVNEFTNVPREFMRRTKSMLYAWQKHGLAAAETEYHSKYVDKHRATSVPTEFDKVVRGRLNFIRSVRGDRDAVFVRLAKWFNTIVDGSGIVPLSFVEPQTAIGKYKDSVVVVDIAYDDNDGESHIAQGTAFHIKDIGWVTCAHVVCDGHGVPHKKIEVYWSKDLSTKYQAAVTKFDKARDVAVLSVRDDHGETVSPVMPLDGNGSVEIGSKVLITGYPDYTPGQHAYVTEASIATAYIRSTVSVLELTAPLSEGISGSPVIDGSGKVSGIITRGAKSGMGSNLATAYVEIQAMADS